MLPTQPVPSHLFAVMFFAGLYLGWAATGKLLTGHSAFFWMDNELAGSHEAVAAYCVGFVSLSAAAFSFMYGLIGMRESMVDAGREGEENRGGGNSRNARH